MDQIDIDKDSHILEYMYQNQAFGIINLSSVVKKYNISYAHGKELVKFLGLKSVKSPVAIDIIRLACQGERAKDISELLGVNKRTVSRALLLVRAYIDMYRERVHQNRYIQPEI